MTSTPAHDDMSDYEQKGWGSSVERLNRDKERAARSAVRKVTQPIGSTAAKVWDKTPGHAALEDQVRRALEGLTAVTLQPAMNSVNLAKVQKKLGVTDLAQARELDLAAVDKALPRTRGLYTVGAMLEGGATAAAVTGAEVASTVTAGTTLGVAAAAIAVDIAASIALMGRIVGLVAAHYGYDVREPEEEAFALGVISVGTAATPAAKVAALTSLSRLAQQMMRQVTFAQLNKHVMVKLIDQVFKALGFRLTKRRLAQTVPILGIALNGGMSAQMADSTFRSARDVYRLRFLTDKYDLDPATWVSARSADQLQDEVLDDVLGPALDDLPIDVIGTDETP